ncbi:glycosyltransferase family 4 protein [Sphingomonas sp. TDK1]|uniref:glycosyltransferase family 4 protein n=1 Tax=Sphingomonas sp. TDK1 TaxID=453247 RepID=UPI001E5871CC|nr:glycosyltransferase family 1 protein [Sphingomonas sp. TDK1]
MTKAIDDIIGTRTIPATFQLMCEHNADLSSLQLRNIAVEPVGHTTGYVWEQVTLPRAAGNANLLCLGNTAPLWPLARNRSVSVMIHDLSYRLYPEAYSLPYRAAHAVMLPLILKRARHIIAVSETEKASISALEDDLHNRITVAQNGGCIDRGGHAMANIKARFGNGYVLYVGSLSLRKNISGLKQVAVRLARERGQSFLFVGSNSRFFAETDLNIPEDVAHLVKFVGHIEDLDQISEIYQNARCLVFPSFYEASPLPPLEAMSCGCPVVGSDIPSMRERCGEAIGYCNPHDLNDIYRMVSAVLDDPDLTAKLVAKGYEQSQRFSWQRQAEHILAALLAD